MLFSDCFINMCPSTYFRLPKKCLYFSLVSSKFLYGNCLKDRSNLDFKLNDVEKEAANISLIRNINYSYLLDNSFVVKVTLEAPINIFPKLAALQLLWYINKTP